MKFFRQGNWSGLPFPSPGDLPDPGIEPGYPALWKDSLLSAPQGKPRGLCHVQEAVIKTILKKKKCKKAKWLSDEALQIYMKRREAKSKGEKERYTHLNAEFQRIARRDKKAFLSDQCKETEQNIIMVKTRDLFEKIRDTKGTFHAKVETIKDRNGMDLTEAEDIKKRWQEYTELYKKDLHDPDNHNAVITHPPEI